MFSDTHLLGPGDPNQAWLVARVEESRPRHLVLLGDIFQSWWGFPGAPDPAYGPLLQALQRAAARGTRVHVVPGNHDFHLGPWFAETLGAELGPELVLELAGQRFLLLHGDQADASLGYRLLRRGLRGRPFELGMRALGPRLGRSLGRVLAGGPPGPGAPDGGLATAQRQLAMERLRQGHDVVVMGHCHAPELCRWERGVYVNLGDGVHRHTWLEVGDDGALALRGGGCA